MKAQTTVIIMDTVYVRVPCALLSPRVPLFSSILRWMLRYVYLGLQHSLKHLCSLLVSDVLYVYKIYGSLLLKSVLKHLTFYKKKNLLPVVFCYLSHFRFLYSLNVNYSFCYRWTLPRLSQVASDVPPPRPGAARRLRTTLPSPGRQWGSYR